MVRVHIHGKEFHMFQRTREDECFEEITEIYFIRRIRIIRIRIICLLPHPPHPWGILPHKARKLLHVSEKATVHHPQKQK